ncbi:LysE family translocator [Vibrio casei]|uniref:LysE family translocator n=1 Tax=Vibrio casei TaxID=673372 RepID=A0A368LNM0_9VIBR|nr:LysE family translocator [Vibrio casei]RCS73447.1 LysE family translocator [Vibrio casei]SJN24897.1 Threonine efflux protein [Vibrio casei]
MDLNNILTFIAVATLLVISPGPNGFLIAKTVPLSGHRAGLANVAGFVAAFYVHGTLSIFGISILLVQSASAFFVFKMLGAAYLMWLGLKSLRNAVSQSATTNNSEAVLLQKPVSIKEAFFEGFLTNILNPKVSIFYLAAFPQFMPVDGSAFRAYSLVTAHSIVNVVWFTAMVFTLTKIKNATNHPKFKAWLNSVTGVVFIGFGAKLALAKSS